MKIHKFAFSHFLDKDTLESMLLQRYSVILQCISVNFILVCIQLFTVQLLSEKGPKRSIHLRSKTLD